MPSDRDHLLSTARLALRGHGRAEPNPLVGCVIVSREGSVVGWGYHERCGGPHAEIHALRRAAGSPSLRGATAYITLAPCNRTGRTGPCTQALIEAGVARVIVARDDPHPAASGGLDALRRAGIEARVTDICPEATAVSDPFVNRVLHGRPWVIAKWAQTLDGRIATRSGQSRWISSEASRHLVHRERGRVDVILTGVGTVLRDDPLLTARGVRVRRIARRVIVDPMLKTPAGSRIVRTARDVPTTIVYDATSPSERKSRAHALERAGVELIGMAVGCPLSAVGGADSREPSPAPPPEVWGRGAEPRPGSTGPGSREIGLDELLRHLVERYDTTNVQVEAGAGLLSRLFRANLVNEAWVFVAGVLLGDEQAMPPVRGLPCDSLRQATALRLLNARSRAGDMILRYRARTAEERGSEF